MNDPVLRRGVWWQQQVDGTWRRWNDGSQTWERSDTPPPPPEESVLPPAPPAPGQGIDTPYPRMPVTSSAQVPTELSGVGETRDRTLFPSNGDRRDRLCVPGQHQARGGRCRRSDGVLQQGEVWTIISAVIGVLVGVIVFASTADSSFTFTP